MILLSCNLRLAAAYVFEKRNRSPVPVMMVSLIFLLPRSRSQSTEVFPAVDDHVNLLMLPLPSRSGQTCKLSSISHYFGMPPENNYYNEVILNDPTLTVNNPVEGHEIQIIIGSPSKVAKGTLIDFAKKLTEHTRVNQGWSGVHAIVESRELRDLSPLGEPTHTEGDLNAWIL